MKIAYLNDLHIDSWIKFNNNEHKNRKKIEEFINTIFSKSEKECLEAEILVIAGDISHHNSISKLTIEVFSKYFNKVYVVLGNHDYYLISKTQMRRYKANGLNRIIELNDMLADNERVVLLHSAVNKVTDIYKGLRIAGCTMTSKPNTEEEISFYNGFMNDSRYIPNKVNDLNSMDMKSYEDIKEFKPDLFISHYPLLMTYSHKLHLHDGSNGSFLCKVDEHIAPINFFGHVHERGDYDIGSSFYTNAIGYKGELSNETIALKVINI